MSFFYYQIYSINCQNYAFTVEINSSGSGTDSTSESSSEYSDSASDNTVRDGTYSISNVGVSTGTGTSCTSDVAQSSFLS